MDVRPAETDIRGIEDRTNRGTAWTASLYGMIKKI